jgi:aminopeptidase N
LNKEFYHQTVTAQQIENYISAKAKFDYSKVFDQYLRNTKIPKLEFYFDGKKVFFRWINCVDGFNLPLSLSDGKAGLRIEPTTKWQSKRLAEGEKKLVTTNLLERAYYISTSLIANQQ